MQYLRVTLVLMAAAVTSGCVARHSIRPYDRDPEAARKIEDDAVAYCRTQRPEPMPPKTFTTDGCSRWPDGTWKDCCVRHDMAYWCGGSFDQRMAADRTLQACVEDKTNSRSLACMMRAGVFIGGAQALPTSFRWGYGWPWPSAGP
jgi:hypothetical protein